jgi:hypothetical protein
MIFAMDLTPLVKDKTIDVREFVNCYIDKFAADVRKRIEKLI